MASKRLKTVDMTSKMSLARMPSRIGGASMISRFTLAEKPKTPRLQHISKFTRHVPRHLKSTQMDYKIRTSVADLVLRELDARDRCIFYQRVYILAKNIVLTIEADSSSESILTKYMRSKTSLVSAEAPTEPEAELVAESEMEETSQHLPELETTNVETTLAIEAKSSQEEYRASLLKITRADIETAPKTKRLHELNFFDQFKMRLEDMVKQIEADQISEDTFTGLLLCMGNSHSLLVLEGTEDTIAHFCQELLSISKEYFEALRVFMVEDRIEETYFDEFIYRHAASMNTTEKFPPSTANDPSLMGPQHWLIKEKLQTICRTLSYQLRPVRSESLEMTPAPTIVIIEEEKKEPKKRRFIKRKKSPKPKLEKPPTPQPVSKPTRRGKRGDGAGDASSQSVTKLSITSGGSMKEEFETTEGGEGVESEERQEMAEVNSITAVEVAAPPATAVEEEASASKEGSYNKASLFSAMMAEKDVDTLAFGEDEDLEPREILSEFAVSPALYNRLLPEVQRIDLVLTSQRFYLDVPGFLRLSQQIPMQADEDVYMWPTHYNYMPLNVFQRMPFDVNLTFGSYDVSAETDEDSSEDEGKAKEELKEAEKEGE